MGRIDYRADNDTGRDAIVEAIRKRRGDQHVSVCDDTFAIGRSVLESDEEVVDLVGLTAVYDMVSRFVLAFDLHAADRVF